MATSKRKPRRTAKPADRVWLESSFRRSRYFTYAALAAVRGPDDEMGPGQDLKHLVTARIRSILFQNYPGLMQSAPITAGEVQEIRMAAEKMIAFGSAAHFLSHLRQAVSSTYGHPVWSGRESDLIMALSPW